MLKKYFVIAAISLSICAANADTQTPFGFDRQMNMQSAEATAINNAVNELEAKDSEMNIMDVIQEKPVVPAGSHKSTYSYEKGKMDASQFNGIGNTNIPSGTNHSKTIYRDDIGRLHFFGKGNIIKE